MPLIEDENSDNENKTELVLAFKMYSSPKPKIEFEGTFNYLSSNTLIKINTSEIPRLISDGAIVPCKQIVRALNFVPQLGIDGFEVRTLPESIQNILYNYKKSESESNRSQLRQALRLEIETLLSKYFDLHAVAFDTVYRITNRETKNPFKAVRLVHVDFPEKENADTFEAFESEWSPRVLDKNLEYDADNLELMVNIWMPLDTVVASPLALCSRRKVDSDRLIKYIGVRRDERTFKAVGMKAPSHNKSDHWFFKPDMKGQCYLFDSTRGIHSATEFPGETGTRESIEVRVGLFKR